MRTFRWMLGMWAVTAVAFPAAAVVGVVTYLLLRRRWPDRAIAVALCALAGLTTYAATTVVDYWDAWAQVVLALVTPGEVAARPSDWETLIGIGPVLGPALGALLWLMLQPIRERSPYNGVDERERRLRAEERRRLAVVQRVQRIRHTRTGPAAALAAPLATGIGDAAGPVVGRYQRGDLGRPWRYHGRMRLPMAHPNNRHALILGATGLGKTETALTMAEWAARNGYQVVYLTCKEPPSPAKAAAPRLAAVAADVGARFRCLAAGHTPYDPMRGSSAEVRDRLIRIEEWGDRYWAAVANTLVAVALELNAEQGKTIDALPDLVYSLVRGRLAGLAKKSRDPRVPELIDAFNYSDLGGALMRYASMAIHLRTWIGPAKAGGWAFEDADLACIELPTVSRPEAATALMRLILRDFGSYLVDPRRRHTTPDGRGRRKVLMVIEEAGAVAGDPVIGREFVNQVERNRDAEAYSVLTAQDPAGFGGGRTWSALSTNAVVLSYRQTEQAEAIAGLAGTERITEAGADYDTHGWVTHQGVARRQHAFKLHPQTLRELRRGEFVVISAGRFAKVAGTLPALAFRLPDVPGVREARHAVERSRVAVVLPDGHSGKATTTGDRPATPKHDPVLF